MADYKSEWILSNMNGTYSSSSASFANLRTYHGLLVKNVDKRYVRFVLLSKLFEEFTINEKVVSIDTNYYRGAIYPEGYRSLMGFELKPVPSFRFRVEGLEVTKSLALDPANDWLVIRYEFDRPPSSIYLHPLLAFRNHHLAMRKRNLEVSVENADGIYTFMSGDSYVKIGTPGKFVPASDWYYNFQYPIDMERGSNYEEDLYHPGYFKIDDPRTTLEIKVSCSEVMPESFKSVKARMLMAQSTLNGELRQIARDSTAFLTKDDIIAGFYWFGPWTRDTMISMPGLLLVTKRFRLAKKILTKYAKMIVDGMLPVTVTDPSNVFSADSSLWFIYALYKYYMYTGDKSTIRSVYPSIIKIIRSYINGNEVVGLEGHLVIARKPQLTWMDARTGDVVFTPRTGLPVEVNALWYNALATVKYFSGELGLPDEVSKMLPAVKQEFREKFVDGGRVLDTVDPDDYSLRPNFVIAFSLPFPVMEQFSRYSEPLKSKLLTGFGLRSLSPDDPRYVGKYQGDQYHRDMSYHNGSVWPWLAGQYITASVRSGASREELLAQFRPLFSLKMIPEIFDGDEPHEPRGCIMQAWSYGEAIRAYAEDLSKAQP
ncbi:MAG: amylo-alpha-1,6-glucosidase [Nitrososphaeria archaeon]